MSATIDKILYTSVIIYVVIMIVIIVMKPNFLYDKENKKFKQFGTNKNETIVPIHIIGLTLCILIYFIIMVYMLLLHAISK